MAKYDQGGGCPCGVQKVCDCMHGIAFDKVWVEEAPHPQWLIDFVTESNKIEGLEFSKAALVAHLDFITIPTTPTIEELETFVHAVQPNAFLRDRVGVNVQVGTHVAPLGGHEIRVRLHKLLTSRLLPYDQHVEYQHLHPFTDGNGRSGRALWLRLMLTRPDAASAMRLGFLHLYYYQSLKAVDTRKRYDSN